MEEGFVLDITLLLALLLWGVVARDAWRAWQPARLLLAGRYADARAAAERLSRSWMRVLPGVRMTARYTIACALHLEGDLEGSLAALERAAPATKTLRGNLLYAVRSIEAANLILLDRDHARASALLEEAGRVHRPPEDVLLSAHARLGLGDEREAEELFATAGKDPGGDRVRLGAVVLLEGGRQREAIFHFLRGLFLVKVGRSDEARRDLEIAARSPIDSVYVRRARAMLAPSAPDVEGPSSVAPQVVAKDAGAPDV